MEATLSNRIAWSGTNNRTAKFNGHTLKVSERDGTFFAHFNGTKSGPYTTELGAKNALRRRAVANSI